jgi:hypothetical protein
MLPVPGTRLTSERLWPIHLKPLPDEILSSWLVRLALAHGHTPHSFASLVWPGGQIWARDLDRCADETILHLLQVRTATDAALVAQTTLRAYEGWVFEHLNSTGKTPWILPLGLYHRTERGRGWQWCPQCLADDAKPYFRRSWRLTWVTLCERHRIELLSRCPCCGGPILFHRSSPTLHPNDRTSGILACFTCQHDLRRLPSPSPPLMQEEEVLRQELLRTIAERGWVEIYPQGPVYSHLYFVVLRQLAIQLALRPPILRTACSQVGVPVFAVEFGRYHALEHLPATDRRRLIGLVLVLLDDWPERFMRWCPPEWHSGSALPYGMRTLPFWFESVAQLGQRIAFPD